MQKNLSKAIVVVQVVKVREKALRGQAEDLKGVVQAKSEAISNASKETEARWREKFPAVEVTHAVEWRGASTRLGEPCRHEAVQRACATYPEKAKSAPEQPMKKLMNE